MADVTWNPDDRKPREAEALERQIRELAPGAEVKMTLRGDAWLVRALAPAGMCYRGGGLAGRDVSATIAELLSESGYPATTSTR